MNQCIFCKIVKGQKESHKVHESEHFLAFLDANPIVEGHTLLITKRHRPNVYELDERENKHMGQNIRVIIDKLKKISNSVLVYSSNGPFASQSVKHFHIHLIPRKQKDRLYSNGSKIILDRSSGFERLNISKVKMKEIANIIGG